jgi:hypothetical protein
MIALLEGLPKEMRSFCISPHARKPYSYFDKERKEKKRKET